MRFYYQFGHVSGTLKVTLYQPYDGRVLEIWKQTFEQGSQWNREVIRINSKDKFQVCGSTGILYNLSDTLHFGKMLNGSNWLGVRCLNGSRVL